MYHKVNDLEQPMSMPVVAVRRADGGARRARLHGRRARRRARPLRRRAAAAGRRGADHLRRRLPRQPRERGAGAAAARLPGRAVRADRVSRRRAAAAAREVPRPRTASSTRPSTGTSSRELERLGVRIESHGISHRPLAELEIDEAAREITHLEAASSRSGSAVPVRAFSYVKGSEADYKPVHLSLVRQAGYDLAFTAVSGANSRRSDPLQLRRYNVEPYSAAHVRARARRRVRPDRGQGHRRRARTRGACSTRRSARRRSERRAARRARRAFSR